jgi:hypothetical protein
MYKPAILLETSHLSLFSNRHEEKISNFEYALTPPRPACAATTQALTRLLAILTAKLAPGGVSRISFGAACGLV